MTLVDKIAEWLAIDGGWTKKEFAGWRARVYKDKAQKLIADLHLVQLDAGQSLPDILYYLEEKLDPKWVQEAVQQDLLKAGWVKKIKQEDYKLAKGVIPWKKGDELPEQTIRKMRDAELEPLPPGDNDGVNGGIYK